MTTASSDRIFVNADRTVMVRIWPSGEIEVAVRDDPGDVWGPPIMVTES